ncbi:SDR family oxidoreductase [Apilactobacillus ozensis]|uniref:SDR family oxidoreductase n=1 Tax=Apilactobacillus ozensis TaxID=866801 RepID=UPI002009EDBE|nr:SDR family oxidoreductase [Apilactobacillus ozensis]MCK8606865.1 SDR family oxidoreductase [Apilactobacillus ozensis]
MVQKVVVITGASSGIGKATANLLISNKNKVVLAARRKDKLDNIFLENNSNSDDVIVTKTDVTSIKSVEDLASLALDKFGRIDVWINCAGIMPLSNFIDGKSTEWDNMIDVNIRGTLYGIKSVLPIMRRQSYGHIINISSKAGHESHPSGGVYSATKAAILMISDALRQEEIIAKSNVRVSVVSPGAVNTELLKSIHDKDTHKFIKSIYNQTAISPNRIANGILEIINLPADTNINEMIVGPANE